MGIIEVVILAIVQAITEFIPVSSSGHLLALREWWGLKGGLAFDVALHFGTLLAVVVYFKDKIISILSKPTKNKSLIYNVVITTIPAATVGFLFVDQITESARSVRVVAFMLAAVGIVMIFSDKLFTYKPRSQVKKAKNSNDASGVNSLSGLDAAVIGLLQVLALVPGTSRSGITMLAARARGYDNTVAAEYSFLAGIPIIAGAALKQIIDAESRAALVENSHMAIVGVVVAFFCGWFALDFLLRFVKTNGLTAFGWYRLGLAILLFIAAGA